MLRKSVIRYHLRSDLCHYQASCLAYSIIQSDETSLLSFMLQLWIVLFILHTSGRDHLSAPLQDYCRSLQTHLQDWYYLQSSLQHCFYRTGRVLSLVISTALFLQDCQGLSLVLSTALFLQDWQGLSLVLSTAWFLQDWQGLYLVHQLKHCFYGTGRIIFRSVHTTLSTGLVWIIFSPLYSTASTGLTWIIFSPLYITASTGLTGIIFSPLYSTGLNHEWFTVHYCQNFYLVPSITHNVRNHIQSSLYQCQGVSLVTSLLLLGIIFSPFQTLLVYIYLVPSTPLLIN